MKHSRKLRRHKEIGPFLHGWLGAIVGAVFGYTIAAAAGEDRDSQAKMEQLRRFTEIFHAVKENYVEPVDNRQLIEGAIRGMATGLDPDSDYLDKSSLAGLGSQNGSAAVGVEIGMEDGLVKVVSAIENTPAFHGGVKSGDLIFKIDATEVRGMELAQAAQLLRGKPGSEVALSILRPGERAPLTIVLKREVIRIQSVKSKWLEPGYAYVRLSQFKEDTGSALARQLKDLYRQGDVAGLLLDLRDNQGGLFNEAVSVSAAFLPAGSVIVASDGRIDDARRTYRATPADYLRGASRTDYLENLPAETKSVPMVVLVNGKSAAASEIVSGALQDHKRAIIAGTPTFGRASIQTVLPIPNGSALKLTTARWHTPSGRSVAGQGIVPDVALEEDAPGYRPGMLGSDRQLSQALGILKRHPYAKP